MARWGHQNTAHLGVLVSALVFLWVSAAGLAGAVVQLDCANGIRATIHTPDDIMGQTKAVGPAEYEIQTSAGTLALSGDPAVLVPFELDHVLAALESMRGLGTPVDVTVYVLPVRPAAGQGSFARRDNIYLAPGSGPVNESTAAYITTHEMGHVLTWAFLDRRPDLWAAYLDLRGLDTITNGPNAAHANRAREILAEDIRFLFGGPAANSSGSIENHDLRLPSQVAGLTEFLTASFAQGTDAAAAPACTAFPNPCNPITTVAMGVPLAAPAASQRALLRVFDLRGALVRSIAGGTVANGQVTVQWNGNTDGGQAAASGRYLYVLQVDNLIGRGTVTLVR